MAEMTEEAVRAFDGWIDSVRGAALGPLEGFKAGWEARSSIEASKVSSRDAQAEAVQNAALALLARGITSQRLVFNEDLIRELAQSGWMLTRTPPTQADWVVYEAASGTIWRVNPPSEETALAEESLVGRGHKAMPWARAECLRNAWANGRMWQVEQDRRVQELASLPTKDTNA